MSVHRTARAMAAEGGDPDLLEARVFLRGSPPSSGQVQILLEAPASSAGQTVAARSRPGALASLRLEPGSNRLSIPLAALHGSSEIALGTAASPSKPPPFEVRSLFVGPPGALSGPPPGPPARLEQAGPSRVTFAFRLPRRAQLLFTPLLLSSAGDPVRVAVAFETEEAAARELWSGTPRPGASSAPETAVSLPGAAGTPVRLGLVVEGGPAQVSWLFPRVLGSGPIERIRPRVERETGERPPAERELRRRLAGLNVVVVVLDAAAAGHFGCYGYPRATTPQIDRLAREGAVFESAYSPAPFTIAAVSSLSTSLQPEEHHGGVRHDGPLPAGPVTLAELLSARGVQTAGFVANPSAGAPFGLHRGFLEFHHLYEKGPGQRFVLPRAEQFRPVLRRWLERVRDRPFYGYVHYLEPHFPYDPPPPFDRVFGAASSLPASARRDPAWVKGVNAGKIHPTRPEVEDLVRLYDGNLAYVDREVGWLRQTLHDLSLLDRTLLVVTADHGEDLFGHGIIGHGGLVREESLHVPLVMWYPRGLAPAGLRVAGLVDLLDLAPTVADVLGVPESAPGRRDFEGQSLVSLLAGGPGKEVTLARTMQERPTYALRSGHWKMVYSVRFGRGELYDLAADPGETRDVAGRHPVRAELMRQELLRWRADMKGRASSRPGRAPTAEEEELLRSLGYVR